MSKGVVYKLANSFFLNINNDNKPRVCQSFITTDIPGKRRHYIAARQAWARCGAARRQGHIVR